VLADFLNDVIPIFWNFQWISVRESQLITNPWSDN